MTQEEPFIDLFLLFPVDTDSHTVDSQMKKFHAVLFYIANRQMRRRVSGYWPIVIAPQLLYYNSQFTSCLPSTRVKVQVEVTLFIKRGVVSKPCKWRDSPETLMEWTNQILRLVLLLQKAVEKEELLS